MTSGKWWDESAETDGSATPSTTGTSAEWWSEDPDPSARAQSSAPARPQAAGGGATATPQQAGQWWGDDSAPSSSLGGYSPPTGQNVAGIRPGMRVGPYDNPDLYTLHQRVSAGTEGSVWKGSVAVDGHHLPVAVKIIADNHLDDLQRWRERWSRQAELLRSLDHPGLVRVREVFEGARPGGQRGTRSLYLVMNWANGVTLSEWSASRPWGLDERIAMVDQVGEAVSYLHSGADTGGVPVLHRDLKPANVIVDGLEPRLVDFGFVRFGGDDVTMVGTAGYIAPEVAAGHGSTTSSDIFSFGALAFSVLAGRKPGEDDLADPTTSLRRVPDLAAAPDVVANVASMLAADPAMRPASVPRLARAAAPVPGAATASATRRPGRNSDDHTVMLRVPPPPVVDDAPQVVAPRRPTALIVAAVLMIAAALGIGIGVTIEVVGRSDGSGADAPASVVEQTRTAAS